MWKVFDAAAFEIESITWTGLCFSLITPRNVVWCILAVSSVALAAHCLF